MSARSESRAPGAHQFPSGLYVEMLNRMFDTSPFGLGLLDADLRLVSANPQLIALAGAAPGTPVASWPDPIGALLAGWLPDVLVHQQSVEARPLVTGTGVAARHFRLSAYPVTSHGVTGVALVITEWTERRRVDEQLRLARAAIDATSTGVAVADARLPDQPIIYVNPAFESITGFDAGEVVGRNCRFLQGPDTDPAVVARIREAVTGGHEVETVIANYRRDGTLFWNELRISPIRDDSGEVSHFVGVQSDITARVRAERQQDYLLNYNRLLLQSASEGVYGIDRDGNCTFVNQAAATMVGLTPEDILGQNPHELMHHSRADGSPLPIAECTVYRALQSGGSRAEDVFWRSDGTSFPVEHCASPIIEDGEATGAVVMFTDISERKRAEAELQRAKEAADVANRAKSQFLANMSHELRTPLNAVIGYCEMLQEEEEDGGTEDLLPTLDKIRAAGFQLLGLVNDVLDLAKVESGRMELTPEQFAVADLMTEVVATTQPAMDRNSNRLEVRDRGAGLLYADRGKVRQCLLNLLSNAAKFTEDGTVTLAAARREGARPTVVFTVTDSGIGIPESHLDGLFEPFDQGDASVTRRFGGTGLGLAISRRLVRMMGGDLTVSSRPGEGSAFTLVLPANLEATSPPPGPGRPAGLPAGGRILVISGDPRAQTVIAARLSDEGWRVTVASRAEDGLALARSDPPDAIVLDVAPDSDGWIGLGLLKDDPRLGALPIVLLSGLDEEDLAYSLSAAGYLTKPVDGERLRSAIERARPNAGPCRVLVVEDDAITRHMLRSVLTRQGWQAAEASNGAEALERLERGAPDMLLIDLMMPTMNGFELIERLRRDERWNRIPVIVITAKDLDAEERRRLSGNVDSVLQKGRCDLAQLVENVRRVLPPTTTGPGIG